jgi:hypothetical protein
MHEYVEICRKYAENMQKKCRIHAEYMQVYTQNNAQICNYEICKKYAQNMQEYTLLYNICNHDFNMQNMQEYALPTLLMMLKL